MNTHSRIFRLSARSLAIGLLVSALGVAAGPPALAQTTYEVEVGRFFNESDHTKEAMRFFPSTLKVHQGDRLRFSTGSFHSVTLLPLGTDTDVWVSERAGGVGKEWSLFLADDDDGAGALKTNLRAIWPSRQCGWPGQPVCSFSGYDEETLHSGLALFPNGQTADTKQLDFTVAINSDPGEVLTIVDVLHPTMRMQVEVVAADESASDPAVVAAASETQFKADAAAAKALAKKYSKKKVVKTIKGKKYRTVWAGVEKDGVALRGYYPKNVTIKQKQGVRWLFDTNIYASHTVTFPVKTGVALASTFPEFVCDADGDAGTEPDSAATSSPPYCPDVFQLELDVPDGFAGTVGDGKYKAGKDVESSGVRGAGIGESKTQYLLQFMKPSSKKGFAYMDLIYEIAHAPMRGKVIVRKGN
jgi:plastocyanin